MIQKLSDAQRFQLKQRVYDKLSEITGLPVGDFNYDYVTLSFKDRHGRIVITDEMLDTIIENEVAREHNHTFKTNYPIKPLQFVSSDPIPAPKVLKKLTYFEKLANKWLDESIATMIKPTGVKKYIIKKYSTIK